MLDSHNKSNKEKKINLGLGRKIATNANTVSNCARERES